MLNSAIHTHLTHWLGASWCKETERASRIQDGIEV